MTSLMGKPIAAGNQNQMQADIATKNQNIPEVQTYFYGLNTASQPYLLNQHSPYLLNFKFDSAGQTLYRRDGHKVIKRFPTGEKVIGATQSVSGDIFYLTKSDTRVMLRKYARDNGKGVEYEHDISSLVTFASGDIVDNFEVITGISSGSFSSFPYFNIKDSDGIVKKNINLKATEDLSDVKPNDAITLASTATPLYIISHSNYEGSLFILIKKNDKYQIAWGAAGSLAMSKSITIPYNEPVYALKAFSDSIYLYCENRVYRIAYNADKNNARLDVYSESYGITSNKLLKAIGTTIFYYGESSGLACMTGASQNSIADVTQMQRPIDNYVSNFHKVFRAVDICHKKDDNSLYIIGTIDCDYIARAIHWQTVYCKSASRMTDSEYEASFVAFKKAIEGKRQFILEYNIPLMRFSLHYYDKEIFGHFNLRLSKSGFEYDQSSELIFTEDYVATTHSDFIDDDGKEFPVQINTIPRNRGLFRGFVSSVYKMYARFTSNSDPIKGDEIYVANMNLPFSITNKKIKINTQHTSIHKTSNQICNVMVENKSFAAFLPSHLIGFSSRNILIFDGVNVEHNTTTIKTI